MTPEDLERLVKKETPSTLAGALAGLSEKERRALSKTATELFRKNSRGELWREASRQRWLGVFEAASTTQSFWRVAVNVGLAVLGVGPLSLARRLEFLYHDLYGRDADPAVRVLADRRPPWASDWLEHRLDQEWPGLRWDTVRPLVTSGVCAKPKSAGYARLMAREMRLVRRQGKEPHVPLSLRLLEDPGLLEDEVWRLFECDTDAFSFDWMAGAQHVPEGYETWPAALLRLCGDGALDRRRLLDASLSGLWITTSASTQSGFSTFHERLEPTADELEAREGAYRELLGHKTPHVVGFALRQLARLQKAKGVDREAFLIAARPVFVLKPKAHPLAVLRLLRRLVAAADALPVDAVALLGEALRHPSVDVQEAAVALLERNEISLDDTSRTRLAEAVEDVAPLVRPRVVRLLGCEAIAQSVEAEISGPGPEDLREDIEGLAEETRRRLALDAVDLAQLPPPLSAEVTLASALEELPRVEPIETVDELIDAVAHAIETVDSVDEVERIVAAIARLGPERPDDFDTRTAPLKKRLEAAGADSPQGLGAWAAPLGLRGLVLTWLSGFWRMPGFAWVMPSRGPLRFVDARLRELADQVAQVRAYQPLAAPTHARGWIEPRALVERLHRAGENGQHPLLHDMTLALLRLVPVGRDEAADAAARLEGPAAAVLRFALGEGERVSSTHGAPAAWWVAAGRHRWPWEDLSERLPGTGGIPDWPDVRQPAAYTWRARIQQTKKVFMQSREEPTVDIETTPALPSTAAETDDEITVFSSPLGGLVRGLSRLVRGVATRARAGRFNLGVSYPTSLPHQPFPRPFGLSGEWGYTGWLIDWPALTWPANADGLLMRGVRRMMTRIDADGSVFEPHHACLQPLFDRWRAWTGPATLALCVGLVSRDADTHRLAMDALIEGVEGGRADPERVGATLVGLSEGGWLKLNRVSNGLEEASRVSSLHRFFVARTLETFVVGFGALPRNSHHLLKVLNDCQVELGRSSPEPLREALGRVETGGLTGRLAKMIRERQGSQVGAGEREALHAAWARRVRLASRAPQRMPWGGTG